MTNVKSTYNFVPAPNESEVYKPHWAEQISQDIPFSDGESGEITLKITSETPIFIRNGHSKEQSVNEFSHFYNEKCEKKYFIPASSLKGMFRNVLEIMSFSRLNKKLVNDDRYSFRDLSRDSLYMKSYETNKVKAGWLKEDKDGKWIIDECEDLWLIHHENVDKILKTTFRNDFLGKQPKEKTAKFKYEAANSKSLKANFSFSANKNGKKIASKDENGKEGTIVFTGQSGPRNEKSKIPSGKAHEFVFVGDGVKKIAIADKMQKDFRFIYLEHDSKNISPDWKFWKEKLEKGERVPVFFNKSGDTIKHFGLSYMYKLPYQYSVHEMLPLSNNEKANNDLANLIFGYTDKDNALKGRVMFGHAIANIAKALQPRKEIFANPKASYFPFYLGINKSTMAYQEQAKIGGYKKYPVHNDIKSGVYSADQQKNDNVFTEFIPLDKGAVFNCKIRFHNLRKIELGALVSAITFHNNSNTLFHSIGGAKSLGYGKIKVEVSNIENFIEPLQRFEFEMNNHLNSSWINSPTITELLSISANPSAETEKNLIYPTIGKEGESKANEFINYKTNKQYLNQYSEINGKPTSITLLSKEVLDNWNKEKLAKQEEAIQAQKMLDEKYNALIMAANKALENQLFEEAIGIYEQAITVKNDNSFEGFKEIVTIQKAQKYEKDLFDAAISTNTIESLEGYLKHYPITKLKNEVEQKIALLKASSGIPERLNNILDFDTFAKEAPRWIKKQPNETLIGSSFQTEFESIIIKIGKHEILLNKAPSKAWASRKHEKKITEWLGEIVAKSIIDTILTNTSC